MFVQRKVLMRKIDKNQRIRKKFMHGKSMKGEFVGESSNGDASWTVGRKHPINSDYTEKKKKPRVEPEEEEEEEEEQQLQQEVEEKEDDKQVGESEDEEEEEDKEDEQVGESEDEEEEEEEEDEGEEDDDKDEEDNEEEEDDDNDDGDDKTDNKKEQNGKIEPVSTLSTLILESDLPGSKIGLGVLDSREFSVLKGVVSEKTLKGIAEMGFTEMTEIQAKSIPALLEGRDLVGSAKTGSGKTLAFLIPAVELMFKLKFMPRNGTGCIIISPTRELSMQTFGVLKELLKYHSHTYGLVMGGANRAAEAKKLAIGVNILVTTPGRLLDHLQHTEDFLYKNLQCLIIDEADRILEVGFEEEMKKIINILPKRRQTMMFSATSTEKTEELSKLALKKQPVYVGVDDNKEVATVEGLEQGYVICPSEKRFLLLFTFLKKNRKKKIMVFFSSCLSVKYHHELLNYIDLPVMSIHGKQKQMKRTSTFFQFCNAESGILLCTDVAARGLDIPDVDWIVQYDPPDDPKEYIHRVGRTARGNNGRGHALLILRPEELGFLQYLKEARVPLNEFEFSWSKVADIQLQLEKLISQNYHLRLAAKEAYKSYMRAYDSNHLKNIYNVETLDLQKVAKSFGFLVPPAVDLKVHSSKNNRPRKNFARQSTRDQHHKAKIYLQSWKKISPNGQVMY